MDATQQKDKDGNDIFIKVNPPQLEGIKVLGKIELSDKKKPTSECKKQCGENHCDTNGCGNRGRVLTKLTTPHQKPKEQKETLHQLRCKVGFRFDKVWKNKKKTREEMNVWATKVLKLKEGVFNVQNLNEAQLEVLSLKLKFELDI